MSSSLDRIDQIIVTIDIDDPMTYDAEFARMLRYSPFIESRSEFSERAREKIRANPPEDELLDNMFTINVYVDKFPDFMMQVLGISDWQRSLTFKAQRILLADFDELEDYTGEEMSEEAQMEMAHKMVIYELSSVGRVKYESIEDEEEEPEDESEDEQEEDEEPEAVAATAVNSGRMLTDKEAKLSRDMDRMASFLLPGRIVH